MIFVRLFFFFSTFLLSVSFCYLFILPLFLSPFFRVSFCLSLCISDALSLGSYFCVCLFFLFLAFYLQLLHFTICLPFTLYLRPPLSILHLFSLSLFMFMCFCVLLFPVSLVSMVNPVFLSFLVSLS